MADSKLVLAAPTLTDHPVDVGHRTEGAIVAQLLRRDYNVLVPFGVINGMTWFSTLTVTS